MTDLKRHMPALARHEGIWDGTYRYYDPDGNKTDEHRSRLVCRITGDDAAPYHQTNHYSWADGKTEVRDFPTRYQFGRIIFDHQDLTPTLAHNIRCMIPRHAFRLCDTRHRHLDRKHRAMPRP